MSTPDSGHWRREGFPIEDLVMTAAGGAVYVDRQLVVTRTTRPDGLRFSGEIDMTNSHAVMQSALTAFPEAGNPHLDLSALVFCDISGIRALVDAAESLDTGRPLMLHGLPGPVENVIRVTGWSDLPSVALCHCAGGKP